MLKKIVRFFCIYRLRQKIGNKYYWYWNIIFFPLNCFYKIFKKKIETKYKNWYIFMPSMSIGDFVMFCGCIKQFKEKNPDKVVVIVKSKKYYDLIKCFLSIDDILIINEFIYYFGFFEYQKEYIKEIKKGFIHVMNIELLSSYCYKTGNKFEKLSDLIKYSLNLNTFQKVSLKYCQCDIDYVNEIWNKMKLNDKTIFISPKSLSLDCNLLNKNFWMNLAKKLTQKGFKVIFNEYKNSKYCSLFLQLSQVPIFVGKCRYGIFFRSGLADLVAMNNKNLIVIYPEKMYHIDYDYTSYKNLFKFNKKLSIDENLKECLSINNIWGKGTAKELIFDCTEQEIENRILNEIEINGE